MLQAASRSQVATTAGLAPAVGDNPRVLILGSLPSVRSNELQQYYAFPTNAFWKIMGDLFGAGRDLEYAARLDRLQRNGIALWDTLASSVRKGSLDANIEPATAQPNDFAAFLERHSDIRTLVFNGRDSRKYFDRLVVAAAHSEWPELDFLLMPSTSAANTTMNYHGKLEQWSALTDYVGAYPA